MVQRINTKTALNGRSDWDFAALFMDGDGLTAGRLALSRDGSSECGPRKSVLFG
jgi:hypothetical protein